MSFSSLQSTLAGITSQLAHTLQLDTEPPQTDTAQQQPEPAAPKVKSARSQNRAAAWEWTLEQWRTYWLSRSPNEAERIEGEYTRMKADGPDFLRMHTGSKDANRNPPPRHKMNREEKNKILVAYDALTNALYDHCRKARGQGVSPRYKKVLDYLLGIAVQRGEVYPSLDHIAEKCRVCRNTVLAALEWLGVFGFLKKMRRHITTRLPTMIETVRQTSNAYALRFPTSMIAQIALATFGNGLGSPQRQQLNSIGESTVLRERTTRGERVENHTGGGLATA